MRPHLCAALEHVRFAWTHEVELGFICWNFQQTIGVGFGFHYPLVLVWAFWSRQIYLRLFCGSLSQSLKRLTCCIAAGKPPVGRVRLNAVGFWWAFGGLFGVGWRRWTEDPINLMTVLRGQEVDRDRPNGSVRLLDGYPAQRSEFRIPW